MQPRLRLNWLLTVILLMGLIKYPKMSHKMYFLSRPTMVSQRDMSSALSHFVSEIHLTYRLTPIFYE